MKKYVIIVFWIFLFLFPCTTLAKKVTCSNNDKYSATIEIDKEKISLSDTAFISVTSETKYEVSYKVKEKDMLDISEEGIVKALKEGSATINVEVSFILEEENDSSCNVSIPITIVSNDSSLKKLTLEELDISSIFQADKYEYEVLLPYKYEKINIIAEANNANAKITGDGRRYLNEGNNEYEIIVTASDGTSTTYKIKIIRDTANDDVTLKNLIVEGYVLTPTFDKDTYEYNLSVDKEIDEITINAEPTYEFAKIKGIGNFVLASGKSVYYVTVTAENGNEAIYKINIDKNNGSSRLKSIEIKDYELDSKFDSEKFIYSITVKNDVDALDINAIATDDDQVEIIGNESFEDGENEVIIRVTGKDKSTTTYKIIVNRLSAVEEKKIEKNNMLLRILLVIFIISIVIMATTIGIFLKRNYKRKPKVKKINKKIIKNKKK